MKYLYGKYQCPNDCKILIYNDKIISSYLRIGWEYLSLSFASKYKYKESEILSNAIRLHFIHENDRIVISPSRDIDDIEFNKKFKFYGKLIKSEL